MTDHPDGFASVYEVRVRGELAPDWSACFGGLRVERDRGDTVIVGRVPDQPALHGLLAKVRDLGLTLLSVRVVEEGTG
jgi:hypothetical protein